MFQKNRVDLVGNLGATPGLRGTGSGTPVTNLDVATTRKFRNAEGELKSETTWHRVAVFGKNATNCCKYLEIGDLVMIEGRLSNRSWTDRDGNERHTTEIVANRVDWGPPKRERHQVTKEQEQDCPSEEVGSAEGLQQ